MAADWHELVVPWRDMQPSIACDSKQVDPRCSTTDIPPPQSAALSLHPVACKLLLINRPNRDGMLSWPRAGYELTTSQLQVWHRTTRPDLRVKRWFNIMLCHGNEIWDKIGYSSAYIRDVAEEADGCIHFKIL